MNFAKQLIILLSIIVVGVGVYMGAYLPLAKAQRFINAQKELSLVKSVDDFERLYNNSLLYYSPIGQEESVKFTASTIGDILNQNNLNEDVSRWFVNYIEPHIFKNDVRHLMLLGNMYKYLWEKYGAKEDFIKSEKYLTDAYNIGSNLPPILYQLFDLYQKNNDEENTKKIGTIILKNWNDSKIEKDFNF